MSKPAGLRAFPVLACLLLAGAIGYMAYDLQVAAGRIAGLKKQVNTVSGQVNTLRTRARKLEESRPARQQLEARLVRSAGEAYSSQVLMGITAAGRRSGAVVGRLTYTPGPKVGGVVVSSVSGSVAGTEAQLVRFFAELEQGPPLAQLDKFTWSLQTDATAPGGPGPGGAAAPPPAPASAGSGAVTFQLMLFGPLAP